MGHPQTLHLCPELIQFTAGHLSSPADQIHWRWRLVLFVKADHHAIGASRVQKNHREIDRGQLEPTALQRDQKVNEAAGFVEAVVAHEVHTGPVVGFEVYEGAVSNLEALHG